MMSNTKYYIINKPYGMLSQFTREHEYPVLGDIHDFPKDVYPVGRLDADSEGLLLLTNDKKVNNLLLDPIKGHSRIYLAQLDGAITDEAIKKLESGVTIRVNNADHFTRPAKVKRIEQPTTIAERVPPIRYRKSIPTSWIEITLTEGKNRQVRKMCAVAGFPCLRLIRIAIEDIFLGDMKPGDHMELSKDIIYKKLKLNQGVR